MSFAQESILDYTFNLEAYTSGRGTFPNESLLNSGNRVLQIPEQKYSLDLRPILKVKHKDGHQFDLKLRSNNYYLIKKYSLPTETDTDFDYDFFINDAYATIAFSQEFGLSIGLQNYQWGPAELVSPSNPIFHFNPDQRSYLWLQRGQALIRLNINFSDRLNTILMVEPFSNGDQKNFQSEKSHKIQALIKVENRFENPVNYFGILYGFEPNNRFYLGEYASFSPAEGLTFYFDSKHTRGSDAYYPVETSPGVFQLSDSDFYHKKIYTYLDVGSRYEWEWLDFRAEFIYHQFGWNSEQFEQAKRGALLNLNRFIYPGLELPNQYNGYVSFRFPRLLGSDTLSLNLREFFSLEDYSGNVFLNIQQELGDWATGFLEISMTHGDTNSIWGSRGGKDFLAGFKMTF